MSCSSKHSSEFGCVAKIGLTNSRGLPIRNLVSSEALSTLSANMSEYLYYTEKNSLCGDGFEHVHDNCLESPVLAITKLHVAS